MSGAAGPLRVVLVARVASLAFLALAAFLFADTTRARRDAGLWHVVSHDADCARDPRWQGGPRALVAEPFHGELLDHRTPPARARCDLYRGYLVVRAPSRLSLELHASGDARVVMGKAELIAIQAGAERVTRRVERPIARGTHLLEIRAAHEGRLAYLRLSALVEPEDATSRVPLATRALAPLDHDMLAPSQVDGRRVRDDASFARRTPARLSLLLVAVLGAIVALGLPSSLRAARAGWTSVDARGWALLTIAIVTAIGVAGWSPASTSTDPHFITHGARAWRTLWLGLPTRSFVDSIPAMGATEWALGASHALGGEEGPAVLAIAATAVTLALLVAVGRWLVGARGAAITLLALVARNVLVAAPAFGRTETASLGIACAAALLAWLLGRTRLGARLARLGALVPSDEPVPHARATQLRTLRAWLVAIALASMLAVALGVPTAAFVPLAVVVLVAVSVTTRDAWLGRG